MDVFYRGDMKSMPDGGGGGEEVVEKSARQRLESTESKNGSKLNGNDSSRSGKHLRMISNWSRSSNKKRRRASTVSSGSSSEEEDTDWSTSVGPSSDSDDDDVRKSRKRRRSALKKSGLRSSDESSSDDSSSESEDISRYDLFYLKKQAGINVHIEFILEGRNTMTYDCLPGSLTIFRECRPYLIG